MSTRRDAKAADLHNADRGRVCVRISSDAARQDNDAAPEVY
jgi:hypothetical protein